MNQAPVGGEAQPPDQVSARIVVTQLLQPLPPRQYSVGIAGTGYCPQDLEGAKVTAGSGGAGLFTVPAATPPPPPGGL